jgi:DNA-binding PadR family transcriptional regulator
MKKGEAALRVLDFLGKVAADTATMIEAILSSPYGASFSRIDAEGRRIVKRKSREKYLRQERQRFYDLLYRLRKDNLIAKKTGGHRKIWQITPRGEQEIKSLKKYLVSKLPSGDYQKNADGELKIIAFDIPEKYKHKRVWLRRVLKNIGFTMLQRSVWVGKYKLPQEFLEDADKLGLLPYLEILAVTKTGSLKEITR